MKTAKVILIILWAISALFMGLGLIVYFGGAENIKNTFNFPLFNFSVIIFALAFTMMTPLYANLMFRDVFWKNQKEIDELREKHHNSIKAYEDAKNKLTKAILDYKPEGKIKE